MIKVINHAQTFSSIVLVAFLFDGRNIITGRYPSQTEAIDAMSKWIKAGGMYTIKKERKVDKKVRKKNDSYQKLLKEYESRMAKEEQACLFDVKKIDKEIEAYKKRMGLPPTTSFRDRVPSSSKDTWLIFRAQQHHWAELKASNCMKAIQVQPRLNKPSEYRWMTKQVTEEYDEEINNRSCRLEKVTKQFLCSYRGSNNDFKVIKRFGW